MTETVEQLSCQELVELVTDYFEGALSPEQRARFDEHLELCDGCTAYLEQMRVTIRTVGRIDEESISAEARTELLHAFRNWRAA